MVDKNSIKNLIMHFEDSSIGSVSGKYQLLTLMKARAQKEKVFTGNMKLISKNVKAISFQS